MDNQLIDEVPDRPWNRKQKTADRVNKLTTERMTKQTTYSMLHKLIIETFILEW